MLKYFRKFKGQDEVEHALEVNPSIKYLSAVQRQAIEEMEEEAIVLPHQRKYRVIFWSFISSFIGIAAVSAINNYTEVPAVVASFGATSVLVFGAVDSTFAQPRNAIFGNILSAVSGVSVYYIFRYVPSYLFWIPCGLSVSLAMFLMQITDNVHPPGGATALAFVISGPQVEKLGFMYIVTPVLLGVCILVFVSVIINNIERQYPRYWLYKKPLHFDEIVDISQTTRLAAQSQNNTPPLSLRQTSLEPKRKAIELNFIKVEK